MNSCRLAGSVDVPRSWFSMFCSEASFADSNTSDSPAGSRRRHDVEKAG